MLRTDIFDRAVPWTRLLLENPRRIRDLNVKGSQKFSAVLAWLLIFSLFGAYFYPFLWLITFLIFMFLIIINYRLFSFFLRRKGIIFTFQAIFFQILYYLYSSAAYAFVCIEHIFSNKPTSNVKTSEIS